MWNTYSIILIDGCFTVQDETCIAVRIPSGGNAVCSVACLAWLWWIEYPPAVSRPGMPGELTRETIAAKEAKNRVACSGNHLGCCLQAGGGLQCGLSGNSVPVMVTCRHGL